MNGNETALAVLVVDKVDIIDWPPIAALLVVVVVREQSLNKRFSIVSCHLNELAIRKD